MKKNKLKFLFKSKKIGKVFFKNKIISSPISINMAKDGLVTKNIIDFFNTLLTTLNISNEHNLYRAVYEEIDRLERSDIATRSYDRVTEWFWLPLIMALLSLLVALIVEASVLRVVP